MKRKLRVKNQLGPITRPEYVKRKLIFRKLYMAAYEVLGQGILVEF